jgi:ABC-type transport system involved in multi-copper enzyme maturation permease subunit
MHLSDFPDRLSPMLVKELRQGMRTKAFVGVFLALQIILGVILLSAGAAASSDDAGETISNIIFIFFSIAVLIIQPMRGITALSSEVKGNTIDMMVLTRLSAWRIVTGKWASIVSQSALLLVTIIPYLILRYFFGGMNLVGEIVFLAVLFLSSAALTAVTVGLSASGSVILRSVLPMIALPIGAYSLLMALMFGAFGGGGMSTFFALDTEESRIFVSICLAVCAYYGFFMLSTGTSLIAPYAENHSTLRRLISLVVAVTAAVLGSMSFTDADMLPLFFTIVLLPVFAISLSEFAPLAAPTYRKFANRGALGQFAGLFLFPGWASGFFFCLVLTGISAVPFLINQPTYGGSDHFIYGLACLAGLLFPAAIINVFRINGPQRVSNYVLILIGSIVLSAVLAGITDSLSNEDLLWLFCWLPPVLMFLEEMGSGSNDDVLICSFIMCAIYIGTLLLRAVHAYRKSIIEIRAHSDSE